MNATIPFGPPLPHNSKRQNLQGARFTRWTVLGPSVNPDTPFNWVVQCDCGRMKDVPAGRLIAGTSQSCGCLRTEMLHQHITLPPAPSPHLENSLSNPLYVIWLGIKTRCFNRNHPSYRRYGAKGITLYPDWIHNFRAFASYIGPRPSRSHSVDRIDGTKGYEPGNIRWATRFQQPVADAPASSTNPVVDYKGVPTRLRDVAAIEDIPSGLLSQYVTAIRLPLPQAIEKCRSIMSRQEDAFTDEDIKMLKGLPHLAARRTSFRDFTGWRITGQAVGEHIVVAYLGRPTPTGKGQWLCQNRGTGERLVLDSAYLSIAATPPPDTEADADWV